MELWSVGYTPLLKEYLSITESSHKRYASFYAKISNKELKQHVATGPHLQIVI